VRAASCCRTARSPLATSAASAAAAARRRLRQSEWSAGTGQSLSFSKAAWKQAAARSQWEYAASCSPAAAALM